MVCDELMTDDEYESFYGEPRGIDFAEYQLEER
jgi:hypothetical protein